MTEETQYRAKEILEVCRAIGTHRILMDYLGIFESPLYKVIPSFDTQNLLICWMFNLHHAVDSLVRLIDEKAMDEIIELKKLNPERKLPVSDCQIINLYDKALLITPSINEEVFAEILRRTDHLYNDAFHVLFYGVLSQEAKRHLVERLRRIKGETRTLNQTQLLFSLSRGRDWEKFRNELIRVTKKRIQTKREIIGQRDADSEIIATFFDKYQEEIKELAHFPDEQGWEYIDRPCPLSRKLPAPEGWDNYFLWEKRTAISFALEKFPPFFEDIKAESMAAFPANAEKRLKGIIEDQKHYWTVRFVASNKSAENKVDFQSGIVLEAPAPPEIPEDCTKETIVEETLNELPTKMRERFRKRLTTTSFKTQAELAKRLGFSERTMRNDNAEFKRIYNKKLEDMPRPNPTGKGI